MRRLNRVFAGCMCLKIQFHITCICFQNFKLDGKLDQVFVERVFVFSHAFLLLHLNIKQKASLSNLYIKWKTIHWSVKWEMLPSVRCVQWRQISPRIHAVWSECPLSVWKKKKKKKKNTQSRGCLYLYIFSLLEISLKKSYCRKVGR